MKKLWLLLSLLLVSCSSNRVSGYKVYKNVSYYYNHELTYIVSCEEKEYNLPIENVYYTKLVDSRIRNMFYVGVDKKLVIYIEMR